MILPSFMESNLGAYFFYRLICLSLVLVSISEDLGLISEFSHWETAGSRSIIGGANAILYPLPRPLSLSLTKNSSSSKQKPNGMVSAQLSKNVNGTTAGNVNFVLNNPSAAYIWSNPLTRILTRNAPNKNIQWQFTNKGKTAPYVGGGGTSASVAAAPASGASPAAPASAVAAPTPPPAAAGLSGSNSGRVTALNPSRVMTGAGRQMVAATSSPPGRPNSAVVVVNNSDSQPWKLGSSVEPAAARGSN